MSEYYIYMMTNITGTLYTGVTNDLERRIYEHKMKLVPGFTKRYNINKLVYFETTGSIEAAITREKQIKGWLRGKKVALINSINPGWKDLSLEWSDKNVILRERSDRRISSTINDYQILRFTQDDTKNDEKF
jgi:putative endonuclease